MYRYDEHDRALVSERVAQFRDQVRRFLAGELGEEEFKQLRLRNGLYRQRHAYMLRVAIPYGLLSARQLRALAAIARDFDRGYGHFTTRQNIQFNWPELERVPEILERLAAVEMHAIQTSGNVVRNITTDVLAGVAADEVADPRPWCELLRQWSTLHPEFSWLPRKFKIALSGAERDRAALRFHDVGLQLRRDAAGELGFRVWVGGGLGRAPVIARLLREHLPAGELLGYLEALLRVYNLEGRRDNIHRARLKVLVGRIGIDAFRERVEAEWRAARCPELRIGEEERRAFAAFFAPPPYEDAPGDGALAARLAAEPAFAAWYRHNTTTHRVAGYRVVTVTLKGHGAAPGDIRADQLEALATLAERYSFAEVRASHEQNLVLAHVRRADLHALWRGLRAAGLASANAGTLTDLICCPGLDYCSLASAGTLSIARAVEERFAELDALYGIGEVRLKVSGCVNACAHHHIGHIGVLGVDKHGEQWYQLTLGGEAGERAALGERLGPAIEHDRVAEVIGEILGVYLALRAPGERFIDTYRRIGIAPFREQVYGDPSQPAHRERPLAACA